MTKTQALQLLDDKFAVKLANKSENLSNAQTAFDMVVGMKEQKRQEIERYYTALEKKNEVDSIVSQGEPIIS